MGLEAFTGKVSDLVVTNPLHNDPENQGDAHIRGIKLTIRDGVLSNTGGASTGQLKGITPVAAEDLTRKDYVDAQIIAAVANAQTVTQAFSAVANANQALVSGVPSKCLLPNELFDTANRFSSGRFTPSVAGYYQINAVLSCSGTYALAAAQIQKNGVAVVTATEVHASATVATRLGLSTLVAMNGTTDYIELWGEINGASNLAFEGNTPGQASAMSGYRVRDL